MTQPEFQQVPLGSIDGWEELQNMTEDEAQAAFTEAFESMTFEHQAWFLRHLDEVFGEEEQP